MTDHKLDDLIDRAVSETQALMDRLACLMPSRIWGLKLGTVELDDAELLHLQTCASCRTMAARVSRAVALRARETLHIPLTQLVQYGLAAAGADSVSSPLAFEGGGWEIQVTPEEGRIICDIDVYVAAEEAPYALARYRVNATGAECEPVGVSEGLAALRLSPSQAKRTGRVRIVLPHADTEFKDLECEIEPVTPENASAVAVDELEQMIQSVDDDEVAHQLRRLQEEHLCRLQRQQGDSWGGLLERVKNGAGEDVELAFYRFVKVSERPLLSYLYHHFRIDPDRAQDCLQETYINIWKGIRNYNRSKSEKAWVYTIAWRCTARILERENRRAVLEISTQQLTGPDGDDSTFEPTFANPAAEDPRDTILQDEEVEILHAAIDRLNPGYRAVVLLRCLSFCSIRETAEILGMPTGTVGVIEHRAKQELREILEHKLYDSPHNVAGAR